jgi:solute carrier family 6 amino acid transporter-like protein 5/7/9/14
MTSVETWITSLFDLFPALTKTKFRKSFTIVSICVVLALLGLILCTQSGTYWVEFFDNYSGNWAILMIAVLECISVTWFYGEKIKFYIFFILKLKISHFKGSIISERIFQQ